MKKKSKGLVSIIGKALFKKFGYLMVSRKLVRFGQRFLPLMIPVIGGIFSVIHFMPFMGGEDSFPGIAITVVSALGLSAFYWLTEIDYDDVSETFHDWLTDSSGKRPLWRHIFAWLTFLAATIGAGWSIALFVALPFTMLLFAAGLGAAWILGSLVGVGPFSWLDPGSRRAMSKEYREMLDRIRERRRLVQEEKDEKLLNSFSIKQSYRNQNLFVKALGRVLNGVGHDHKSFPAYAGGDEKILYLEPQAKGDAVGRNYEFVVFSQEFDPYVIDYDMYEYLEASSPDRINLEKIRHTEWGTVTLLDQVDKDGLYETAIITFGGQVERFPVVTPEEQAAFLKIVRKRIKSLSISGAKRLTPDEVRNKLIVEDHLSASEFYPGISNEEEMDGGKDALNDRVME